MNARKNKKVLIMLSSVMALGTLGAVLAFSNFDGELSRASSGVSSSIVFSRDSGDFTRIDEYTASVSGRSFTGAKYYAVSRNKGDITDTSYIAQFGSGKGYDEQYITFSTGATDTSDFEFEGITGIKVTTTAVSDQTMYLFYSSDGVDFSNYETVVGNSNPSKVSFESSFKYVRLGVMNVTGKNIVSVELFYDCGVEPEKELSSISVSTAPTKTSYIEGENFDPTGLVITRTYSDSSSDTYAYAGHTSEFSFSPSTSTALTTSDSSVTISYGGKSCSQSISVSAAPSGLTGTYAGTYTSFEFTSSATGIYIYGNIKLYFSYVVSDTKITFTYVSGDNNDFGNYKLFNGSSTTNETGSILNSTQIKVATYGIGGATNRTFAK